MDDKLRDMAIFEIIQNAKIDGVILSREQAEKILDDFYREQEELILYGTGIENATGFYNVNK